MKIIASLLLLLLATIPAAGEEAGLGRLFLTPQQRQALDQQRLRGPGDGGERHLTVNGEVRRSGGGTTRWINGQADWSGTGPRPKVPVGDSFDPSTGAHQPLLDGGHIVVNPRQP
ncbi:hypothetical protein [Azonexus sp.]|jgi:hypothetical protein|uniref:hypothetical protein n=1 Tax=Azonexus sp. TaxID=1872668 RepID=UPI002824CAF6|nr:hypothetical protein [Azonexus sp.]MDR1996299.1 hypothetical protein [Azonexus sp.]